MELWGADGPEIRSVCMLHVRLLDRFVSGERRLREVAVPPAVLEDTTAESILGAVRTRLGWCLRTPPSAQLLL
eukprot:6687708-Alexandrium_andersonii.AAC.1